MEFPYPNWLCQCGMGSLGAEPCPTACPLCGHPPQVIDFGNEEDEE